MNLILAEERINIDFDNTKEFVARFFMTPDIEGFEHFDKNTKMTNLRSKFSEPEQCRALLSAFHILTNKKYLFRGEKDVNTGDKKLEATRIICDLCGYHNLYNKLPVEETIVCQSCQEKIDKTKYEQIMVTIPVYERKLVWLSRYPRVFHSLKSKWFGIIETSSARDGHLIKSINERRFVKEETLEDKTQARTPGFMGMFQKKRPQQSTTY